jgi:hypothetical protein
MDVHVILLAVNPCHLTAFWGATSCQGEGNVFHLLWEPGPPKVTKYSYAPYDVCPMHPSWQMYSREALCERI